MLKKDIKR